MDAADELSVVPATALLVKGMREWAHTLRSSFEYATEVLCEIPFVVKWLDAPLVEVFIGEHPHMGVTAVVIGVCGTAEVLTEKHPMYRRPNAIAEGCPIVVRSNNEDWFLKEMDSSWDSCYAIEVEDAFALFSSGENWTPVPCTIKCFQAIDGRISGLGEVRLLLVTVGVCYLYVRAQRAVLIAKAA